MAKFRKGQRVVAATGRPSRGEGIGCCGGYIEATVIAVFGNGSAYALEPVDPAVTEALGGEDLVRHARDLMRVV